jgi:hypothetical protein
MQLFAVNFIPRNHKHKKQKYHSNNKVTENEMGGQCGTHECKSSAYRISVRNETERVCGGTILELRGEI